MSNTERQQATTTSKRSCGFISFLPLGMSCRGRAEAFARRLQFRLRSLNSQDQNPSPTEDADAETAITATSSDREDGVTIPLKLPDTAGAASTNGVHQYEAISVSDGFDDVDLNGGVAGRPIPPPRHHQTNSASYIIAGGTTNNKSSPITFPPGPSTAFFDTSVDNVSLSSSEGTYFDLDGGGAPDASGTSVDSATTEMQSSSLSIDYYDCDEPDEAHLLLLNSTALSNTSFVGEQPPMASAVLGGRREFDSSDSGSESLPASQSTSLSSSSTATYTGNDDDTISSSVLDETMQKQTLLELCLLSEQQYTNCAAEDGGSRASDKPPMPNVEKNLQQPSPAEITPVNSDEDTTHSSPDTDEPLAADPVLESVMENRDDEEAADEEMVVNDDDGNNADAGSSSCNEEADMRPQRLRRCSSLKTGKTPPGTPGRKKFVRFADVLGLDLADVKTFMDEIPTVPRSAYDYLTLSSNDADGAVDMVSAAGSQVPVYTPSFLLDKMLTPMFQQPGGMSGFLERVRLQNVCLENAAITDPICLTISGTVRVRNLDFHKSVHLRYTLDDWQSYADFQATYVEQSCDGFSDKFTFTIFGNSLRIGQRLEMAVRFSCKGEQFWDSNYGVNYCFQCVPAGPTATTTAASGGSAMLVPAMDSVAAAAANEADMLFY